MARNDLQRPMEFLGPQGKQLHAGLLTRGGELGIESKSITKFASVIRDADSAETAFQQGRAQLIKKFNPAQAKADDEAKAFIQAARSVLQVTLGRTWSARWADTGLTGNSLKVPGHMAQRLSTLEAMAIYFKAHPELEVPALGVTAAKASELASKLATASNELKANQAAQKERANKRTAATTALRKRMRGIIHELDQVLTKNDSRWQEFGLNAPGAVSAPAKPKNLSVEAKGTSVDGTQTFAVSWTRAPRAERYRVFRKVEGVDTEFVFAESVTTTKFTLEDIAAGRRVTVRVSAANGAGESGAAECSAGLAAVSSGVEIKIAA